MGIVGSTGSISHRDGGFDMGIIDKLLLVILILAIVVVVVCLLRGEDVPRFGDALGIAHLIEDLLR
jgi:hypothetical protein